MPLLPPISKPVPYTTHDEADRVYGLVRSGRDINEWTDDEKVAFVNCDSSGMKMRSARKNGTAAKNL